jgi:hypothetical protein
MAGLRARWFDGVPARADNAVSINDGVAPGNAPALARSSWTTPQPGERHPPQLEPGLEPVGGVEVPYDDERRVVEGAGEAKGHGARDPRRPPFLRRCLAGPAVLASVTAVLSG